MGSDSDDYSASFLRHAASIAHRKAVMGGLQRTLEEMKRWQRGEFHSGADLDFAAEETEECASEYGCPSCQSDDDADYSTYAGPEDTDTEALLARFAARHRRVKSENVQLRQENERLRLKDTWPEAPRQGKKQVRVQTPGVRSPLPARYIHGHSPPTRHHSPGPMPATIPVSDPDASSIKRSAPAEQEMMQTELGKKWQARLAQMNNSTMTREPADRTTSDSAPTQGPPPKAQPEFYNGSQLAARTFSGMGERLATPVDTPFAMKGSLNTKAVPRTADTRTAEEYAALQKILRTLEAEKAELHKELEEQRGKWDTLIRERRQETERWRAMRDVQEAKCKALEERLLQQQQAAERLQKQQSRDQQRDRQREKERQAALLRDRELAMQQEIQELEAQHRQAQQRWDKERNSLGAKCQQLETEVTTLTSQVVVLQTKLEAVVSEKDTQATVQQAQIQTLRDVQAGHELLINKEQERAKAAEAKAETIERELATIIHQHNEEKNRLNVLLEERQCQARQQTKQFQALQFEMQKLESKFQAQEETKLRQQLEWERQLRDAHNELKAAHTREVDKSKELTQYKKKLKETQEKVKELNDKVREAAEARLALEQSQGELEAQLQLLMNQLDQRTSEAAKKEQRLNSQVQTLQEEVQRLVRQLEGQTSEVSKKQQQFTGQLQAMEEENKKLAEQLQQERQYRQEQEAALQRHVTEVARLRDNLAEAEILHQEHQALILRVQQELRKEQMRRTQAEDRLTTLTTRWQEEMERHGTLPGNSAVNELADRQNDAVWRQVVGSPQSSSQPHVEISATRPPLPSNIPRSSPEKPSKDLQAPTFHNGSQTHAGPQQPTTGHSERSQAMPVRSHPSPSTDDDPWQPRRQVPRSLAHDFDLQASREGLGEHRNADRQAQTYASAAQPPATTAFSATPPSGPRVTQPNNERPPPPQRNHPQVPDRDLHQPRHQLHAQPMPAQPPPSPRGASQARSTMEDSASEFSALDDDDDDDDDYHDSGQTFQQGIYSPQPLSSLDMSTGIPGLDAPPSTTTPATTMAWPAAQGASVSPTAPASSISAVHFPPSSQAAGQPSSFAPVHSIPTSQPLANLEVSSQALGPQVHPMTVLAHGVALLGPTQMHVPQQLSPIPWPPSLPTGKPRTPLQGMAQSMARLGDELDAVMQQSKAQLALTTQQFYQQDRELAAMREELRHPRDQSFGATSTLTSGSGSLEGTSEVYPVNDGGALRPMTEKKKSKRKLGSRRAQTPSLTSSGAQSNARDRRCRSAQQ